MRGIIVASEFSEGNHNGKQKRHLATALRRFAWAAMSY